MANGAIVVAARSDGMSVAMVNRGPQLAQLVNGY